jgi:hypothetical protein
MKDAPVPRSNIPASEKDFLAELEALTKQSPDALFAMNIQSMVRIAKAHEEMRDCMLDLTDMADALLKHFGIELPDDEEEKP